MKKIIIDIHPSIHFSTFHFEKHSGRAGKYASKKLFLALLIISLSTIYSRDQDIIEHVLEGNLALPTSQQPGPLFCFGQTVIDKGDIQAFVFEDTIGGKNKSFSEIIPNFVYGITDNLSLSGGIPFAAKFKNNNFCSSGIEDIYVQLEYAFYNKDTARYANQATLVTAVSFPSGSTKKNPSTGIGSASIFFGLTANHMATDWYFFGSPGILLTTGQAHKNLGQIYFYQFGIGKNLNYVPSKRIITLIGEFFGATSSKNNITSTINKNLISNGFYVGPSLWISTPKFIFNTGIAFNLSNPDLKKDKFNYFFALEVGYKFNS